MRRVAIQGIRGSFHHIAACEYFVGEEVEPVCCDTFADVFEEMRHDSNMLGFMAIENTIAGSLLQNYELLRKSGTTVVGEHKLHIEHTLMCLPDDDWADITEVNSHPVALMQCQEFLAGHPEMKVVEMYDTAGSAEIISRKGLRGHACICHHDAAAEYGMKVLQRAIEDNKHNFTRFLVLSDKWNADNMRNLRTTTKSSIVFSVSHTEGCLSQVLSVFSFYRINLTKIQSLPIIGREWEYLFYVDVVYDDYMRFTQSIDAVTPLVREIRILGNYNGKN